MAHYWRNEKKLNRFRADDYETPDSVLDMVLEQLDPKRHVLWEPFKGTGRSTDYMRKKGFEVTNGDNSDFFQQTLPRPSSSSKEIILVSNPPFSKKREILEHLKGLGVRKFALLLPVGTLFTRYFAELFPKCSTQLILTQGRVKFIDPVTQEAYKGSCSFDVVWICVELGLMRSIDYKRP